MYCGLMAEVICRQELMTCVNEPNAYFAWLCMCLDVVNVRMHGSAGVTRVYCCPEFDPQASPEKEQLLFTRRAYGRRRSYMLME